MTGNPLSGRVAVVTGGGRGIGRAIAQALSQVGADVVLAARTEDQLEQSAREINEAGGSALPVPTDVTRPDAVNALRDHAIDAFGKVDILVNNAGSLLFKPLIPLPGLSPDGLPGFQQPTTDQEWRGQIDVHLTAAFHTMRAFGAGLLERGWGRVVNIGSVAATRSARFNPVYEAAKGGLATFTRSMAKEWARHGVTVNCIAAGHFHTDMTDDLHESESGRRWMLERVPMRRPGRLEEIGSLAAYLCREDAGFLTGQVIHLDGGESL